MRVHLDKVDYLLGCTYWLSQAFSFAVPASITWFCNRAPLASIIKMHSFIVDKRFGFMI